MIEAGSTDTEIDIFYPAFSDISNVDSVHEFRKTLDSEGIVDQVKVLADSYFTGAATQLQNIPSNEHTELLDYLTQKIKDREK